MNLNLASYVLKDIASYLLDQVEKQLLSPDRAEEISQHILEYLDENMADDQVYMGISSLLKSYPELSFVLKTYIEKKENTSKEKLLEEAQNDVNKLKVQVQPVLTPAVTNNTI